MRERYQYTIWYGPTYCVHNWIVFDRTVDIKDLAGEKLENGDDVAHWPDRLHVAPDAHVMKEGVVPHAHHSKRHEDVR